MLTDEELNELERRAELVLLGEFLRINPKTVMRLVAAVRRLRTTESALDFFQGRRIDVDTFVDDARAEGWQDPSAPTSPAIPDCSSAADLQIAAALCEAWDDGYACHATTGPNPFQGLGSRAVVERAIRLSKERGGSWERLLSGGKEQG